MGAIADDLRGIVVTATSPDGRIEGQMESTEHITLRFVGDSYENYFRRGEAEALAHQLGRGATLLATAYQRARRAVMLAHDFERYSLLRPPFTARHREYSERGAGLTAHGSSAGQEVRVWAVALTEFRVALGSDLLDLHEERAFLQLARTTGARMRPCGTSCT
jgi:hypothetical protein